LVAKNDLILGAFLWEARDLTEEFGKLRNTPQAARVPQRDSPGLRPSRASTATFCHTSKLHPAIGLPKSYIGNDCIAKGVRFKRKVTALMNILFIEDEQDLQASGMMQLELKGHKVYPARELAESRAILTDESIRIDLIISDHRLPDGLGIQFLLEIREQFPGCKCVIVSGCLTPKDIETLNEQKIPYYQKPLLYNRVLEDMRNKPSASAPVYVPPEPEVGPEAETATELESEAGDKKKAFGFWPFR